MRITKIRIRNFRSIQDITIPLEPFTVFCGPNSCGKSNIFRAVQLAFKEHISADDAQTNLPTSLINSQGAPNLSIWVDCDFADVSTQVQNLIKTSASKITYSFRLSRRGTVTRKLGSVNLDQPIFAAFLDLFSELARGT